MKFPNLVSFFPLAALLAVAFSGGSALAQTTTTQCMSVADSGGCIEQTITQPPTPPAAPQKSACPPRHARVKISFELDGAEIAAAACVSREQDPEFLLKTLDVLSGLGKRQFLEAVDAAPKK
jgi:hypothetical protein